jgi:hypothetical protein
LKKSAIIIGYFGFDELEGLISHRHPIFSKQIGRQNIFESFTFTLKYDDGVFSAKRNEDAPELALHASFLRCFLIVKSGNLGSGPQQLKMSIPQIQVPLPSSQTPVAEIWISYPCERDH